MTMLKLRVLALVVVMGLACGKDSAGPGPTSSGSLVLSPPSLGFSAVEDGTNPASGTIAISNGTSGTLRGLRTAITYPPNQPTGWLAVSLSDTIAPSTLTLTPTTGALRLGIHTAFVTVTANGAVNGPQVVEVSFLVSVNGIFVSTTDPAALNDASCGLGPTGWGTGFHPCLSITQGLTRATQLAKAKVLVADGLYNESVTLLNGVSVLGGHDPETWERHLTTTNTVILGAGTIPATGHAFAVRASGITTATIFEGFVVHGPINGSFSGNSYAVYVSNPTANLTIRNNVIFSGRGGPGASGAPGANGALGVAAGAYSALAYDAFIATGTGSCNTTNNRQLNNGGVRIAGGDDISGGRGGGNSCPVSTTRTLVSAQPSASGQAGAGVGGGAGGTAGTGGFDATDSVALGGGQICVLPTSTMDGGNGTAGGDGGHGAAAAGGSGTGSVVGGHWTGAAGSTGNAGANGGGGGGGGAGGGAICKSCAAAKDRLGAHGGGAGSGGAGGGFGGAGGSGGGAFGLFVAGTVAPTVSGNVIVRGDGGVGGSGGNGGAGGLGGTGSRGGAGDPTVFCTGNGGRGGDGGAGGHGSGGGGGGGGGSYAIYTSGIGAPTYCDPASSNAVSGGSAGTGGQGGGSLINPGGAGGSGTLASCSFN